MKAIVCDRYGGPEVLTLREVPAPAAQDGEILIRVHASVATPPDVAFRKADPAMVRLFTGLTKPKHPIPGTSLAGVVEAVGAGVTRFRPGDRVYGATDLSYGAYAELKAMPQDAPIAAMPKNLDFGEAVGLSEGFLTALPFLRDNAKLAAGQSILINGAAGSIGTVAVQLAKHYGARVTAVCSTGNIELVRGLGADAVIDRGRMDFTQATEAYDVIFDTVGKSSFPLCRRALKPGGVYMTTVPSIGILTHMLPFNRPEGKRALLATTGLRPAADKTKDLALLTELAEAGVLRAVVDRRYPLAEAAEAHRYVETGRKRGSVVLTIA